ncbi:hypothetical protein CC80DRAFT_364828, partial [Byssothecium circinans]
FNLAIMMGLFRNKEIEQYVIRIPAHGTEALWTKADKYLLQNQVALMEHIRLNCPTVPVPKVFSYSATLDNPLGVPYILMQKLEGLRAGEIWFDE